MTARTIAWFAAALLTLSVGLAAATQPKRVLILHSFGPDFGDEYANDLRAELNQRWQGQLELYEDWLVGARFALAGEGDAPLASYLGNLFRDHPLDLIITIRGPAANFIQKYRRALLPSTPVLLTDVEERRVALPLTANDTAVVFAVSIASLVESIVRIRPQTTSLVVVIGNSPVEQYWIGQVRSDLRPFGDRLSVTFLNGLSFGDLLKRVAALPPGSAILFMLLTPDVAGIPRDETTALTELHAAANAPIFNFFDAYFGEGIVGGPMISGEEFVDKAADAAVRILAGERASDIRIAPIRPAAPQFDWRELKRWKIREADLPPGSIVRFRDRPVWERYRWQITAIGSVILLQTVLIVGLLYERRLRKQAEIDAHQRIAELAHMNRRATVGELSASIAHELYQPLGAILRNTEAAELMLASRSADLTELTEILGDIKRDDQRASEVIRRLRALLAKQPIEAQQIDLNEMVGEVLDFLSAQASARGITLRSSLAAEAPRVRGDRIQLQQVILNLVLNGMEAIAAASGGERLIIARTAQGGDTAEVSIEDSGTGVPADKATQLFEPFFTTKQAGMGLGLSIARTIVTSHGGKIWAENRSGGGAAFRFTLPLAKAKSHESAHAEARSRDASQPGIAANEPAAPA
jgi:signal transduction histidine kinase